MNRPWTTRARRRATELRLVLLAGVVGVLLCATTVAAESTWTDGSPPPEDFGFQDTATQSSVSAYNWLYSTDSGATVYSSWTTSGVVRTDLQALSGGVATGMNTADASAPR
ncbi:MAG TPA: hypothetical protein VFX49_04205 [Chloroflexota bacterium]|nr:hypothetical protein [Chloroflexota bacterium]